MKILIIDDDKAFCGTLEKILLKKGYEVTSVHDPMEVIPLAKENEYELMLLDHRMSPITGVDLLEKLRNEGIKTPVILLSAYASRDTYYETKKLGIVNYLNKPFSMEKLEELIDNIANNS
ncbi:MAG: response regulator [Candidatus Ancaeobacter aquaticus]|nr:response regulator [Candidatus Ancaeobacter aquaticus]